LGYPSQFRVYQTLPLLRFYNERLRKVVGNIL
jgi:hypothetical protein